MIDDPRTLHDAYMDDPMGFPSQLSHFFSYHLENTHSGLEWFCWDTYRSTVHTQLLVPCDAVECIVNL